MVFEFIVRYFTGTPMKKIFLLLWFVSGAAFASQPVPASLKKFVDAGVLGGEWVCGMNTTVKVGRTENCGQDNSLIILNTLRDACADNPEQVTFQTHSPFKSVSRWTNTTELKDLSH